MEGERPITREAAASMIAQAEQAIAAGQDHASVNLAGMELRLERTRDGGFTLRAPGQPVGMLLFERSQTRPAAYPPNLPFVPGEPVTLTEYEGTFTLIWWAPADADRVVRDLDADARAADWTLQGETRAGNAEVAQRTFAKGDLQRTIMSSSAVVSLLQRSARMRKRDG